MSSVDSTSEEIPAASSVLPAPVPVTEEGQPRAPGFTLLPNLLLKDGRMLVEAMRSGKNVQGAFDTFCSAAFVKPEWAGKASQFLAEVFEEDEDRLADLARIPDLIIELSSGSVTMTCVVASRWAAKGENHRLIRLAEAMIAAHSKMPRGDAVDVMLALATSLAVTRFPRAEQLFTHALPLAEPDQEDAVLEARQWLAAGKIVRGGPQEILDLWDQRLRRVRQPWTWASPEEREALLFLARQIDHEQEGALLFKAIVPPCWWDLVMKHAEDLAAEAAAPEVPEPPAAVAPSLGSYESRQPVEVEPDEVPSSRWGPFLLGGIFGALTMGVVWILIPFTPPPKSQPAKPAAAASSAQSPEATR